MLCEIATNHGFFALWIVMTVLGLVSMVLLSSTLFIPYYVFPTFEKWQMKNNPKFPSPLLVKKEIIHMCKGLSVATLCPAFTLMASKWGLSQGYCGNEPKAGSLLLQGVIIFVFSDLFEYLYHCVGHRFGFFWAIHRHHHMFYNPTPFAVIADEYLDQFVRTTPLIILPLMMPTNMDLLFAIYTTIFYAYGVYLHWGFESKLLNAHNPIFNTAYHHYLHHAVSAKGRPIYTGFFVKAWDQMFGTEYDGACSCFLCRPTRTHQEWEQTPKPDYSVLLSPHWWFTTNTATLITGKSD